MSNRLELYSEYFIKIKNVPYNLYNYITYLVLQFLSFKF